jgi:hypothetical protein
MLDIPCQERWKPERAVIGGVVTRRRDHGEYGCPASPPRDLTSFAGVCKSGIGPAYRPKRLSPVLLPFRDSRMGLSPFSRGALRLCSHGVVQHPQRGLRDPPDLALLHHALEVAHQ